MFSVSWYYFYGFGGVETQPSDPPFRPFVNLQKNVEKSCHPNIYYLPLRPHVPDALLHAKNYAIHKGSAGKLDKSTLFFYILPQESYRSI